MPFCTLQVLQCFHTSEPKEQQEELYTGRVHRNAEILSTGNAEDICQLILKL